MKGYLHELFSLPSCHDYAFKFFRSGIDITLADFWGINKVFPEYNSIDLINTEKANRAIATALYSAETILVSYEEAMRENSALVSSELSHPQRTVFYKRLSKVIMVSSHVDYFLIINVLTKIKLYLHSIFHL